MGFEDFLHLGLLVDLGVIGEGGPDPDGDEKLFPIQLTIHR